MKTSRVIWGIICLAFAGLILVLYLVLPSEKFVFMMGEANVPYVPAIVLGVVGIVLLATAQKTEEKESAPEAPPRAVKEPEKVALNKRLESIAWGFFLIMLGGLMFVPKTTIREGFWSIGIGIIMLGLNFARYLNKIKMSGFTTVLGVIAIVGGVLQLFMLKGFEGAVLIIILGAYLIVKPWFDRRKLFGKPGEE